jgi:galactitol PTS system EIIA component
MLSTVPLPLYRRELCWVGLGVPDAVEAMRRLARGLAAAGCVRPGFEEAVLAREASSPTGLPMSGRKLAVPHADPEHVITPAVAICTLARPVAFREMGNPTAAIDVDVVAMLALTDHESAQHELVRLIERCQRPEFLDGLCAAADPSALYALLEEAP